MGCQGAYENRLFPPYLGKKLLEKPVKPVVTTSIKLLLLPPPKVLPLVFPSFTSILFNSMRTRRGTSFQISLNEKPENVLSGANCHTRQVRAYLGMPPPFNHITQDAGILGMGILTFHPDLRSLGRLEMREVPAKREHVFTKWLGLFCHLRGTIS